MSSRPRPPRPFYGSSVLGPQLWRNGCLITVRERVAFLARILGRDSVINRNRFGARGGELERVGRPSTALSRRDPVAEFRRAR